MTKKVSDLDLARSLKQAEIDKEFWLFAEDLPLGFSKSHCAKAREMVGWSVEALAFRSGVSVKAIKELELGARKLRRVTMQALSFSLEKEGLIFFPGHEPMRGNNCWGGTTNPRGRDDFHLIE